MDPALNPALVLLCELAHKEGRDSKWVADQWIHHMRAGHISCGPDYVVMFKEEEDCWFITAMSGRSALQRIFSILPHKKPYIMFRRGGKRRDFTRKCYEWSKLERAIKRCVT